VLYQNKIEAGPLFFAERTVIFVLYIAMLEEFVMPILERKVLMAVYFSKTKLLCS
jgi:hypothetical protein